VLLAGARSIDVEKRKVFLGRGELNYDYLIVATGATHAYFGHDDWAQAAPGLKILDDALNIRRKTSAAPCAAHRYYYFVTWIAGTWPQLEEVGALLISDGCGSRERRRGWLGFSSTFCF
jgi:hypothetical protein